MLHMWLRSYIAVAVATTPIRPVAWEPPYAVSVALKRQKKKKKEEKKIHNQSSKGKASFKRKDIKNAKHCLPSGK